MIKKTLSKPFPGILTGFGFLTVGRVNPPAEYGHFSMSILLTPKAVGITKVFYFGCLAESTVGKKTAEKWLARFAVVLVEEMNFK